MAKDASPGVEVATIKPSKPGTPGRAFTGIAYTDKCRNQSKKALRLLERKM
jgi:hypothetical protein